MCYRGEHSWACTVAKTAGGGALANRCMAGAAGLVFGAVGGCSKNHGGVRVLDCVRGERRSSCQGTTGLVLDATGDRSEAFEGGGAKFYSPTVRYPPSCLCFTGHHRDMIAIRNASRSTYQVGNIFVIDFWGVVCSPV